MPSDNILTVLIPGFKRPLDILFPNGKLPVCKRCKRIFKTRELCRERDGHTDMPWNTTYLCFLFDDSCLGTDSAGITRIIDEDMMNCRFSATLLDDAPDLYHLKHEEITRPHTPICSLCKKKNYTRYHCREKQQHLHLPWVTFYIKLTATPCDRPEGSLQLPDNALMGDNSPWGNEYDIRNNCQSYKDNIYVVGKSRALLFIVSEDSYHLRWLGVGPITDVDEGIQPPSTTGNSSYPNSNNFSMHNEPPNYSSAWPHPSGSISNNSHVHFNHHNQAFVADNLASMNFGYQGYGGMSLPGNHYGSYQQPLLVPSAYQDLQQAQHARNMALRTQSLASTNPYYGYPESEIRAHENLSALSSLSNSVHQNPYQTSHGFSALNNDMMQMPGQYWQQQSLHEAAYPNVNSDPGNFLSSSNLNSQLGGGNGGGGGANSGQDLLDNSMFGSSRYNPPDGPGGDERSSNR